MSTIKPLLKWVGGKSKILNNISNLFPNECENYYEPFLGGGSVLLHVISCKKIRGKIYANDLNTHLIDFYKSVRDNPEELYEHISFIVEKYNNCSNKESFYYLIRDKFNKTRCSIIEKSAMFIFLNKTCFRGLYREGPNGFNVSYGNYKNPKIASIEHIREVSKIIKDVLFFNLDYKKFLELVDQHNNCVYLDPPYVPVNKSSFVGYTKNGFNEHIDFFKLCVKLGEQNNIIISNSIAAMNELSNTKFKILIISCMRTINSKNPNSKEDEILAYKII